ncbi:hypothetical protein B0192_14985 [Leptospira interrogans serovar Australis]|nr:hypothetical protein B0192_14985 [Leptospira interrogans serovar Australis]
MLNSVVVPTNLGSTIKLRIQLFNRNKNLLNNLNKNYHYKKHFIFYLKLYNKVFKTLPLQWEFVLKFMIS